MYVLQIIVFVPTGLYLCIKLPECAEAYVRSFMSACGQHLYLVVYAFETVCPSSCCACNPSKLQGSALLCRINESLTSIATCRL